MYILCKTYIYIEREMCLFMCLFRRLFPQSYLCSYMYGVLAQAPREVADRRRPALEELQRHLRRQLNKIIIIIMIIIINNSLVNK